MMTRESITSAQLKQLKRIVEDAAEQAPGRLNLDKDALQRAIECGDEIQTALWDRVAELAKPKPKFVNDRTKDGWELLEDVGLNPPITSAKKLELVPFLKGNESYINGEVMLERARGELHANLGQQHAEWVLANQKDIPKEFRKYYLVFTGTVWRDPDGNRVVACLGWSGGEWFLFFYWLGNEWHDFNRLLRLRE